MVISGDAIFGDTWRCCQDEENYSFPTYQAAVVILGNLILSFLSIVVILTANCQ